MNSAIQPESLPNPHLRLCSNEKSISVSPLFATHRSRSQIIENPLTLSPLLATHTDFAPVTPVFATHTKTAGVYTNNSHSGTPATLRPLDPVTLRLSVSTFRRGFLSSPLPCNNFEARMSRPKNFR